MNNKLTTLFSAGAIFISILACGGGDTDTNPDQPGSSFQQCGGIAGFQCDDPGEVCVQDEGMCMVADSSGTCQEVPTACNKNYDPVCACDGTTYGNACLARMAGAAVSEAGECAPQGGQGCGTRGAGPCTGDEVCIWQEGANCGRADAPGVCQVPPAFCTEQYDPVCGCDGQTYGNECAANSAGVSTDYSGECSTVGQTCGGFVGIACSQGEYCSFDAAAQCGWADATGTCAVKPNICPQHEAPVCACDGTTYGNACKAHAAGVSVYTDGPCAQNGSN